MINELCSDFDLSRKAFNKIFPGADFDLMLQLFNTSEYARPDFYAAPVYSPDAWTDFIIFTKFRLTYNR